MKDKKLSTDFIPAPAPIQENGGAMRMAAKKNLDGSLRSRNNMTPEEGRAKILRMRERDSEMVTGIFRNLERRGGTVKFTIKLHDYEPETYTLTDGTIYQLPRGVVRRLNQGCFTVEYVPLVGANKLGIDVEIQGGYSDGRSSAQDKLHVKRKNYRFAFDNTEFSLDDIGRKQDIIEVSY